MIFIPHIESVDALIVDQPIMRDYPAHYQTASDLELVKGEWEEQAIQMQMNDLQARNANADEILQRLVRLHPEKGALLDFGSFAGTFGAHAESHGWRVTGLEPLSIPAIFSRGHFGLDVVTDTLREGLFEKDSFDVITAFQVFEHLTDPAGELSKLRSLLKPDGLIVIEVPNIATWGVQLLGKRHRHFVEDHVNFFSAETLARLLLASNLTPIETYFPTRKMSTSHFASWLQRLNVPIQPPKAVSTGIVSVNVGDIVTVIARRSA